MFSKILKFVTAIVAITPQWIGCIYYARFNFDLSVKLGGIKCEVFRREVVLFIKNY